MDAEDEPLLKGQTAADQPVVAEPPQTESQPVEGGAGEGHESAVPATATDVALEQDA